MNFETADLTTLNVEISDRIATITLDRPKRLNALTADMCDELALVFTRLVDADIRVAVLTGSGRAFCAGADVRGGSGRPLPIHGRYTFFNVIEDAPLPTIAAINGACIGGGLELALCCDLRVAADEAKLGLGEVKLGVIPAGGGTARLPRLIGTARAKELLYLGDAVSGTMAATLGIVNRSVPRTELDADVREVAASLANQAPLAIRAIKRSVNAGMQMGIIEAVNLDRGSAAGSG